MTIGYSIELVSKLIALIPDGDDSFNETKALISEHKNGDEDLTMSGLHDKISELGEPALNGFLRSLRSIADLREVEETVETDGSGEEDETPTEMEDDGAGEVEEDEIETAPEPEIESAAAPVVQPPTSPIADLRRDGGLSPLS